MFTFLSVLFVPVAAWLFLPFRRPFRWSRLLWTFLLPVIPFVLFFDGLISCLRSYSLGELQEMTSGLAASGYRWEIGERTGGLLSVRITYVIGCPQSVSADGEPRDASEFRWRMNASPSPLKGSPPDTAPLA